MPTPTGWGPTSNVPLSGERFIDSLLAGTKWGGAQGTSATVTFSFPGAASYFSTNAGTGYGPTWTDAEPWSDWYLGANQESQTWVKAAMRAWSDVANIKFSLVPDNASTAGDIRIAWTYINDMDGASAHAYFPIQAAVAGDIWLNNLDFDLVDLSRGSWGYFTILHELGHAIGLKHSFSTRPGNSNVLPNNVDAWHFTVMSYEGVPDSAAASWNFMPTTPMPFDIAAAQYIYGKNNSFHAGDDVYVYRQGNDYFETIWDAGGTDTIKYIGNDHCEIDLRGGALSNLGNQLYTLDFSYSSDYTVSIYDTVKIEKAIGGNGGDLLIGSTIANTIMGNGGNDTIEGGNGNDRLFGGAGNDSLVCQSSDAKIDGGIGTDTLRLKTGHLDLVAITDQSRIVGIETIDMTGGGNNQLKLSKTDLLDLSGSSDTIRVLGNAGDSIDIVGRFSLHSTTSSFSTYKVGGGFLQVDTDITAVA